MSPTKYLPSIINFCCKLQSQDIINELSETIFILHDEAAKKAEDNKSNESYLVHLAEAATLLKVNGMLISKAEEITQRYQNR